MASLKNIWKIAFLAALVSVVSLGCSGNKPSVVTDAEPSGGSDGDGIADEVDNCPLDWNPDQANLDGDAFGDVCDDDDDNDGRTDGTDNCTLVANANQVDTDGDGIGDVCDGFVGIGATACVSPDDSDSDGVPDPCDNCVFAANPTQADLDADAAGDACDLDDDGDGIQNEDDNCPRVSNVDQADEDFDGLGDVCDECVALLGDTDGDGLTDDCDNCPNTSNLSQSDDDRDGAGDACDNCPESNPSQDDTDLDGVGDDCDNCVDTPNANQDDEDGDGIGDLCDNTDGEVRLILSITGTSDVVGMQVRVLYPQATTRIDCPTAGGPTCDAQPIAPLSGFFVVNTGTLGVITLAAVADTPIQPVQAVVQMDFTFTGDLPELSDFSIDDGSCLLTDELGALLVSSECRLTSVTQLR